MSCDCCGENTSCQKKIDKKQEKKEKRNLLLYLLSIGIFILTFVPILETFRIILYLLVVLIAGYDLLYSGVKNLFHFQFKEDTLMTIAVIAAFILGEFPESCMVVLLFKLGEFLEDRAVQRSQKNIEDIVEIKANEANLIQEDSIKIVKVEELRPGDTILIKPGEKVPVDCNVIKGESNIDTSAVTGESKLLEVKEGQDMLSGSVNMTSAITCEVIRDFAHSTASQIIDLVYEATNNKGKTETLITRFSKIYTPTVIMIALLIAIIPLFMGFDSKVWIMRALFFLVASCPCSLVISIPLSFFSCVGAISKKGLIIKGTKHVEELAKVDTICLDKTGTITTGKMTIDKFEIIGDIEKEKALSYLSSLEALSNHPIASAIEKIAPNIQTYEVINQKEIPGHGLYGEIEEKKVMVGNQKLMKKYGVTEELEKEGAIYLAVEGKIVAYCTLKEEIRKDSKQMVEELKKMQVSNLLMLTGDHKVQAEKVAKEVGIKSIYSGLLPQEKMKVVQQQKQKHHVIFIGDGINDSPVLATSHFGISMGEGTQIANNTADAILLSNRLGILPKCIQIARKSMNIIRFNISVSLFIKFVVLFLGFIGFAPIWAAILADTGVTLLTVLNSLRIFQE